MARRIGRAGACALLLLAACLADSGARPDAIDPPACRPAVEPTCSFGLDPVSCDGAMATWFYDSTTSPRTICERECADGRAAIVEGSCVDGFDFGYCGAMDVPCDACCRLSDQPTVGLVDHDPCTRDACDLQGCTHRPWEWIRQACTIADDYGTCPGVLACSHVACFMGTIPLDCGGAQVCEGRTPGPEFPSGLEGVDDDCDGATDEADPEAPLRLGPPGSVARGMEIRALDDERFAVTWVREPAPGDGPFRLGIVSRGAGPWEIHEFGLPEAGKVFAIPGAKVGVARWKPASNGGALFLDAWDPDTGAGVSTMVPLQATELLDLDVAAHSGDRFTAAWLGRAGPAKDDHATATAIRVGADGAAGNPVVVADAPVMAGCAVLALPGDRALVAWFEGTGDGDYRARARRLASDGTPDGAAFDLGTTPIGEVAMGPLLAAMDGGAAVAAWSGSPGPWLDATLRARVIPATGLPSGDEVEVDVGAAGNHRLAGLAAGNGQIVVGWLPMHPSIPLVFGAQVLDGTLHPVRSEVLAAPVNGTVAWGSVASLPDGTLAAAWAWTADPQGMTGGPMEGRVRVLGTAP